MCVLYICRSLCHSLSSNTHFVEKLFHSSVAKLFSQTERQELSICTDVVTCSVPLHTTFAFPSPGWYCFHIVLITYNCAFLCCIGRRWRGGAMGWIFDLDL